MVWIAMSWVSILMLAGAAFMLGRATGWNAGYDKGRRDGERWSRLHRATRV